MLSNILRPVAIIALCAAYSVPNLASLRADELNIAPTSEASPTHQPSRVSRLSQYAHWASVGLAAFTGLGSLLQRWQDPSISYAYNSATGYPSDTPTFTEQDLFNRLNRTLSESEIRASIEQMNRDAQIVNFLHELKYYDTYRAALFYSKFTKDSTLAIYKTSTHAFAEFAQIDSGQNNTQLFWAPLSSLTSPYSSQLMRTWHGISTLVAAGLAYWLYRHPPQAPAKTALQTAPLSRSKKITKALSGAYVDPQTQTRTGLGLMLTGAMIALDSYLALPKDTNFLQMPMAQTLSLSAILMLRGIAIASNRP
jgi:hypothetical protein